MTPKLEPASIPTRSFPSQVIIRQPGPSGIEIPQERHWNTTEPHARDTCRPFSPAADIDTAWFGARRCGEKGCVFPASEKGTCLYHERLDREPGHFRSLQPSLLALYQARCGFSECQTLRGRAQDRQRLDAQRQAFWEGLA